MTIPLPKDVQDNLYHVIGGIIIRFGFLDTIVSEICRVLFEDLGGHPSYTEPVKPLGVRLKYIGKCVRKKPELAGLKATIEVLIPKIRDVAELRNHLAHGYLIHYDTIHDHVLPPAGAPRFQFLKIDPKPDNSGYVRNSINKTQPELEDFLKTCGDVTSEVAGLLRDVLKVVPRNKHP